MNTLPESHANYNDYSAAIQVLTEDQKTVHIQAQAGRLHGNLNGIQVQQDEDQEHLHLLNQLRGYEPHNWNGGSADALTRLHIAALHTAARQATAALHVAGPVSDTDHTDNSGSDSDHSSGSEADAMQIHPAPNIIV